MNITFMKTTVYLEFMVMLLVVSGCSTFIRSSLPTDYTDINHKVNKDIVNNDKLDKSFCDGQLMMLEIGWICPGDTVSVYMNDTIVIENITTDYSYPYIDKEEYGGHGEHYYDFLLYKKKCSNKLFVVNLRDPQKKIIKQVKIKDSLRIKDINENGSQKEFVIPKDLNHFLEIRFLLLNVFYADTLQHVSFFD